MALATAEDVSTRLGRDLTEAEEANVEQSIEIVSGLILEVAGTAEPDSVPAYYRALCIEKVLAVGSNPNGLAQLSEQLGAWSHSKTFRKSGEGSDLFLTEHEERQVRRIANNAVSGSTRTDSLVHDVYAREAE